MAGGHGIAGAPAVSLPQFAIDGGVRLALVRASFVTALLGAFGTALFGTVVLPPALSGAEAATIRRIRARLCRLGQLQMAAALGLLAVWVVLQSAALAGASTVAAALAALPVVLRLTTFGHLALLQAAGVLLALAPSGPGLAPRFHKRGHKVGASGPGAVRADQPSQERRPASPARLWWQVGMLAIAVALQAGHGHAWSRSDRVGPLLIAMVVHLLAAGGWLGGLVPLLLAIRGLPPRLGASACRWFSPLGKYCIAGIVGSAGLQFFMLVGGLHGMVSTAYGWMDAGKSVLLAVLLGFALGNRYWLAPGLRSAVPERARSRLLRSIGLQTATGILTIGAAAVLSSLPPAHP